MKDNAVDKNHKWKKGQSELLSRCLAIIECIKYFIKNHERYLEPCICREDCINKVSWFFMNFFSSHFLAFYDR